MAHPVPISPAPNAPAPRAPDAGTEILRIVGATLDPRSWLAVNPDLHIGGTGGAPRVSLRAVGDGELEEVLLDLRTEGYLGLPDLIAPADAARLEAAVTRLQHMGWPPVFAFVYDELWETTARLGGVLSAVLGEGYRQLPDFWAWYIPPSDEARGWVPHRDRPGASRGGHPSTLTVWVALSEATPRNGCMYILPKARDPRYGTSEMPEIARGNLQDLRALPGGPGTVFLWDQDVYHWGGRSSARARRPRISFACEFQRGDLPPYNTPLIDPQRPPDLPGRLRLIGKQLRQYQHMHRLTPALALLAERLTQL